MATRRVLVCAPTMPEFDREGGSRRIFHLLEFFQQAGWTVSFAADNATGGQRYAKTLQQMGIAAYALEHSWLNGKDALIDPEKLFRAGRFDLVLFAFWSCAEKYTPLVRALSPASTLVVDSIDLHFLRESRRVFCNPERNGHPHALDTGYAQGMMRELNAYAATDAVLTVSDKEAEMVNDFVGKSLAYSVPDTEDSDVSTVPFAQRKGMLFVGNFRHPPNVQAVEYLCQDILPMVPPAILAEHPVYIVGNDPSEAVLNACRKVDGVRLVGWVPSVLPYLQRARVSLIPLCYGAGTKRKLMQSLMVGTPSVSTSIGVEGLNVEHDRHVLVADDETAFAAAIKRLISDEELWERLSIEGRNFITTVHGREAVFGRFTSVLAQITKSVLSVPIFCEELQAAGSTHFDDELDRTISTHALRQGKLRGTCNVSASETEFIISSANLREDVVSTVSSSINRHRQLVCTLSMALFGRPSFSLAGIAAHINQNSLKVYIAEANSVMSDFLKRNLKPELIVSSEYFGPDHRSGEKVKGILHQDLQRTSFGDETFDILVTSEVFEHIPDAISAEKEVMRILKPGGVYCFTVPFLPAAEHDLILASMDERGTIQYFAEPQFHGDPIRPEEGILVYRLFSFNDMKQRFESLGHEFKSYRFWSKALGILGDDCWAHAVRKGAAVL